MEQTCLPIFGEDISGARGTTLAATFSPCRRYRYELWRRWGPGPYALFCCLNPSTADETLDDPTIRRCIRFSQSWGFGAFCMANIFGFRATDPADMKAEADPVGPGNDEALVRLASGAGIVIAGWGVHGSHLDRDKAVLKLLSRTPLKALGLSKDGHPRHPLYLKSISQPMPYEGRP